MDSLMDPLSEMDAGEARAFGSVNIQARIAAAAERGHPVARQVLLLAESQNLTLVEAMAAALLSGLTLPAPQAPETALFDLPPTPSEGRQHWQS